MRIHLIWATVITLILAPFIFKEWTTNPSKTFVCEVEQEHLGPYQMAFVIYDGEDKFYLVTPDGFDTLPLTSSSIYHKPITLKGRTGWFNFQRYLFVEKIHE